MTLTADNPTAPVFCILSKHVDLFCNTVVQCEQIAANIAGNALIMLDHGFVKGKRGRACGLRIGCQATLRSHDSEPRQSQCLI